MALTLTDTHCHLDFHAFDQDSDEVIQRARQAGIVQLLNPGADLESSRSAVALAERYSEIYAAVGVHPNDALSFNNNTLAELQKLTRHTKVFAIGEIGLDYYRDRAPRELQIDILQTQLNLAEVCQIPVVIHNRNANADIMRILEAWCARLVEKDMSLAEHPGVLHSFSGDAQLAAQAMELKFYIGISGPVTFLNAKNMPAVVADVPLDRLLIETDAPFLTPHPHRGKRNEPAYVRLVAEKIASLKGVSLPELAEQTRENAARLFGWQG